MHVRPLARTAALLVALSVLATLLPPASAEEVQLTPGAMAPEFSLVDQGGEARALSAFRKHWVVLYFYPKDDTPGCTTEACQFRDDYVQLKKLGAEVLGVSIDNHESHAAFSRKYHLPFPLLADRDGAIAKRYGALWGLGPLRFARRHTFLIDPEGRIAKVYRKVTPASHSREVIDDLKALQHRGDRGA